MSASAIIPPITAPAIAPPDTLELLELPPVAAAELVETVEDEVTVGKSVLCQLIWIMGAEMIRVSWVTVSISRESDDRDTREVTGRVMYPRETISLDTHAAVMTDSEGEAVERQV